MLSIDKNHASSLVQGTAELYSMLHSDALVGAVILHMLRAVWSVAMCCICTDCTLTVSHTPSCHSVRPTLKYGRAAMLAKRLKVCRWLLHQSAYVGVAMAMDLHYKPAQTKLTKKNKADTTP